MTSDAPSEPGARARELSESVMHWLLSLMRYHRRYGSQLRQDYEISGRQLAVLRFLKSNAPCSVGDISQFLYVCDATTSPLLERMERDGYVTRRRCAKDNRRVLVEPTDKGLCIVEQAPMGVLGRLRVRLPELSADELERIDAGLARLWELAQAEDTEGECETP